MLLCRHARTNKIVAVSGLNVSTHLSFYWYPLIGEIVVSSYQCKTAVFGDWRFSTKKYYFHDIFWCRTKYRRYTSLCGSMDGDPSTCSVARSQQTFAVSRVPALYKSLTEVTGRIFFPLRWSQRTDFFHHFCARGQTFFSIHLFFQDRFKCAIRIFLCGYVACGC